MSEAKKRPMHIPMHDVDDLAFKTRNDPTYVASITNMMQVPATITLNNGSNGPLASNQRRSSNPQLVNMVDTLGVMDVPDKLTANGLFNDGYDMYSPIETSMTDDVKETDTTATPPSTPTKTSFFEPNQNSNGKYSKTPQVAADLYKRMKPRRSSIEDDLHAEIRMLRDRVNALENECQVNTRSCNIFYAIICGYVVLKTVSWLVKGD